MKQILLPVVQQFLNAENAKLRLRIQNRHKGTIIIKDGNKNQCKCYAVSSKISKTQDALRAHVSEMLVNWQGQSITMGLQVIRLIQNNNSALILTKYCALVLEPLPRIVSESIVQRQLVISSTTEFTQTNQIDSLYIDIKKITTDVTEIKGLVMEHSI